MNRSRNDYIVAEEIQDYFKDNKIYSVTREEAQYLIHFFDSDNDSRLSYPE